MSSSPDFAAGSVAVVQSIEDLEPIDKYGVTIEWWQATVTARKEHGKAVPGHLFQAVPDEAVLGQGAYGRVWLAREKHSGTTLAVKNIAISRQGLQAIAMRECEIADHIRTLPHPCVVGLVHVHHFMDANLYCLVMEFCPGGDLKGKIAAGKRGGAKTGKEAKYDVPRQALHWIGQIFLGLEHLHRNTDCLLRDLKPDNVVLDERGRSRLTDFGCSRLGTDLPDDNCWTFGMPPGTPGYVSPEVLRSERYDCSADLYSFGVLIWVLLTGGLTSKRDPQAPYTRPAGGDYRPMYNDWKLLEKCIKQPQDNFAHPLEEEAKQLVLQLVGRTPQARPTHQMIRRHPYIQPLKLPDFGSRRDAIGVWMNTMPPI